MVYMRCYICSGSWLLDRERLLLEDVDGRGVLTSTYVFGFGVVVSRPGVALKTEYSSAKIGVHPERLSKASLFARGVWKLGLGNAAEVGVWPGVGG